MSMDASSFSNRDKASNAQFAQLLKDIVEQRHNANISDHVLTVLLTGQVVRFLDNIELLTSLVEENNRLVTELLRQYEAQPCDECAGQFSLHLHQ